PRSSSRRSPRSSRRSSASTPTASTSRRSPPVSEPRIRSVTRLLAFSRFGVRGSAACLLLAILAVVPAGGAGKTAGGRPSSSPSNDAVARVNGQPILGRDFDLAVQLRFSGRRPANVGLQELRAVREKVLE